VNEVGVAAALRKIAAGLSDLARALDDSGGDEASRKAAALARFDVPPEHGLSQPQASAVLREHRLSPHQSAAWARHGLIACQDDKRWLTDLGRERLRQYRAAA
jgi:hypothetical protein